MSKNSIKKGEIKFAVEISRDLPKGKREGVLYGILKSKSNGIVHSAVLTARLLGVNFSQEDLIFAFHLMIKKLKFRKALHVLEQITDRASKEKHSIVLIDKIKDTGYVTRHDWINVLLATDVPLDVLKSLLTRYVRKHDPQERGFSRAKEAVCDKRSGLSEFQKKELLKFLKEEEKKEKNN